MSVKVCKNCPLYNAADGICNVNIIRDGEFYELKTKPDDECFWVKNGIEVQQISVDYDGNKRTIKY